MTSPLDALRFLVGRWHGAGLLDGAPVTSRGAGAPFAGTFLRFDVETEREGRVVHRERILYRAEPDGRLTCTTSPWRGDAQVWDVAPCGDGAWRLTHPGLLWEIRREDDDRWSETFDVLGGAAPRRLVSLRHVREHAPEGESP